MTRDALIKELEKRIGLTLVSEPYQPKTVRIWSPTNMPLCTVDLWRNKCGEWFVIGASGMCMESFNMMNDLLPTYNGKVSN